jgi:hypothetical protein
LEIEFVLTKAKFGDPIPSEEYLEHSDGTGNKGCDRSSNCREKRGEAVK